MLKTPMQLVPVIDLQAGQVVHATGGDRLRYRPIRSALVDGCDPVEVARRLCEHCATDTLYLADLDALQGRAAQFDAVAALLDARPRLHLWLDAGFHEAGEIDAWMARAGGDATRLRPVLASESLASLAALREAVAAWPASLLSLDSRAGVPLDRAGVWQAVADWPDSLIAMDLARVGASGGPDLAHLRALRERKPDAGWIGSGGLRDDADVAAAAAGGARAWLVASALHAGRIAARAGATDCGERDPAGHTVSQAGGRATVAADRTALDTTTGSAHTRASHGMRFAPH